MKRKDQLTRMTQGLDVCVVQQLSWPGMRSLISALGDILQASDNLSRVINSYKTIVEGQVINGEVSASTLPDSEGTVLQFLPLDPPDSPSPQHPAHVQCQPTGPEGLPRPGLWTGLSPPAFSFQSAQPRCLWSRLPAVQPLVWSLIIPVPFHSLIQETTTLATRVRSSTWRSWMHQAACPQCWHRPPLHLPRASPFSLHPPRPQGLEAAAPPARWKPPQGPAPASSHHSRLSVLRPR